MKHYRVSALMLAAVTMAGAGVLLGAPTGSSDGEVLSTYSCSKHGYTLRVIRPSNYNENSDARQIQVHYNPKSFHATWNEVSNLSNNYPPNELEYYQIASNPGAGGERFCARTGHLIPTDETVYSVRLDHYNDYNGNSSVFFDSGAEVATLTYLAGKYNNSRDQGDALPLSCHVPCLSGGSGVSGGGSGNGPSPGTYTSADGQVHDLFDLNPPAGTDDGGGTPVRPSVEAVERAISRPSTGPVDGTGGNGRVVDGMQDRTSSKTRRVAP
ncbi:hypothetical protein [Halomonas llamarensis]|uniref:Uncharacterized protein n=1 Tax=Halomonas llamarensis TaxID=2945104 RepID=A0ABT0SVV7_9GAMM|nr:hypothetical protein [Halomonas llamarensis]MCL7931580.1 hypothetical protein [Halomonas llamarensis]